MNTPARLPGSLFLLLLLIAKPSLAVELFACTDQGVPVFSDRPCAVDARRMHIEEPPVSSPSGKRGKVSETERQIAAWERRSRAKLPPSLGGSARSDAKAQAPRRPRESGKPTACERVRRKVAEAYAERSLSLSFDQRRAMDERVRRACL